MHGVCTGFDATERMVVVSGYGDSSFGGASHPSPRTGSGATGKLASSSRDTTCAPWLGSPPVRSLVGSLADETDWPPPLFGVKSLVSREGTMHFHTLKFFNYPFLPFVGRYSIRGSGSRLRVG